MNLCGIIFSVNPINVGMSNLLNSFEVIDNLILKLDFLDRIVIFLVSACLWKNLVFLSPSFSQRLQIFYRQYSSSSLQAVWSFLWRSVSFSNMSGLIFPSSIFSWWTSWCYWASILWTDGDFKDFAHILRALFSLRSFSSHTKKGEPETGSFHTLVTRSINSSCWIQDG